MQLEEGLRIKEKPFGIEDNSEVGQMKDSSKAETLESAGIAIDLEDCYEALTVTD